MKLPRRLGSPRGEVVPQRTAVEEGLVRLMETCATTEGQAAIVESLRWTLRSLLPEQNELAIVTLVGMLPASARLAILSQAVPVHQIAAYLSREERKPTVIRDLVEHGRESRTLDLALVPEGCLVELVLYRGDRIGIPTEKSHLQPPTSSIERTLRGLSMGGGKLQLINPYYLSDRKRYLPEPIVTISARNPLTNERLTTVGFGRPAWIHLSGYKEFQLKAGSGHDIFVGTAHIDGEPVFFED